MGSQRLEQLQAIERAARAKLIEAELAAFDARVPYRDLVNGARTAEPVTVGGWYAVETHSGRRAVTRVDWAGSRWIHHSGVVTYNPGLEETMAQAGHAHYEATNALEMEILHEADLAAGRA